MIETLDINENNEEKEDYSKYIVDNKTIDKELTDFLDGKIEQGFKVGIDVLDNHFVAKKNEMTLLTGKKGSGKTTINQSIQVMQSVCNGLIWVVAFQENSEWSCKLNYLQFVLCDFVNNVRKNNPSKYESAKKFIEDHFIFINVDDIKTATEVTKYLIEEKGIDIHGLFLDPINSFRNGWQDTGNSYSDGVYTAREVLLFCKHYCSVYISQHPNMFGQRQEGAVSSNQGEGGWWFNKTHNAVVNHREKGTNNNEFIVENIRNKHTGGSETETENPVVIEWSPTKINICYKDQSIRHKNVIQEMIYKHRPFIYDGMKEEQKNFEKPIINTILNGSLKDAFG